MPDEFFTQNPDPKAHASARQVGAGRALVAAALMLFVVLAGAVGYVAWQGATQFGTIGQGETIVPGRAEAPNPATAVSPIAAALGRADTLEARMAALERRLDAVDLHADAASGNAARAEALLVAFAARRALDRGAPLGFLEDQLRLRFGDAQPNAVAIVIDTARAPITLDQLAAGLDTLAPQLTEAAGAADAWTRMKRELSSLIVVRHDSAPSPAPALRLSRARVLLSAGKTRTAIAEVQGLPGAADAAEWVSAARRYDAARRALDVLETTALLDTRGLRDAGGTAVDDPSPITPAPAVPAAPQ
ncbi:MAG: hypothetical protein V4579_07625 [Pseudomonadota bacterium]